MTTMNSKRAMEEERMRLAQQINEWNANRYDLFAISLPNEENEFFGVMRFFFQETGSRVSTKCIRVSNTASTQDVLNTLIEKFRPDMRMLSLPRYALYEVHVNGEERKLREDEYPLVVQLNWGKDDREGRFLLKNMDEKTALPKSDSITNTTENPAPEPGFKRKLSKREKKEQKKREKEAKLKDKENKSPGQELYKELPDTSFTRSISNPEAVMRRRRQIKLEKKLQQIRSQDGGPDKGGTLKIYGESVRPDVPYKTLLLSTNDTAAFVVKETLEKYGMDKEDPENYCLVQVLLPPGGPEYHGPGWGGHKEYILEEDDCPLSILMHTPPSKGTVMFQLKRRPADMPKKRKKRSASANRMDTRERRDEPASRGQQQQPQQQQSDDLPFLVEINPDGSEPYKARKLPIPPNGSEVGSEQAMSHNGQYIQLHGPDILPRHCVFTFTEGLVTLTPIQREAETFVNDNRIHQTTMLQHGNIVRFGKLHIFRFCDPFFDKEMQPPHPVAMATEAPNQRHGDSSGPGGDAANFETTFDVDGHIETKSGPPGYNSERPPEPGLTQDQLPCSLEYKEEGEEAFLASLISDVNSNLVQFKLAPTYCLYMAVRYRVHKLIRMDISHNEQLHWINAFGTKVINRMQQVIQESRDNAPALSFWMANSSELLHFLKQDGEVCPYTKASQDHMAQVVQAAFHHLVDCMQVDLQHVMAAFLDEGMEDLQNEDDIGPNMYQKGKPTIGDVLQVLSSAMSLLRRCRVNAALTIQLFSQLFHFINMWLFNKIVLQPQLQLCTAGWGHRLKRRLGRVEKWAEKHGLELAADCHLSRIIQAAHLLEAPKSNPDVIADISSTCFKLNSLQLRALLERYLPSPGEPHIPPELISRVVAVAQNMSDELLRSEGREVRLEEEPDLQLPFLLPEDGYSCDIVKGVPAGLPEFLGPVTSSGLCRLNINNNSSGLWTAYIGQTLQMGARGAAERPPAQPGLETLPPGLPQEPEVVKVTFPKVKGSIGLSIVAAKGEGQRERGIYIKSVVPGGGAALDGRLQAGDELLKVDGQSLVGLTQERAAEHMMHTGHTVTLEVAKQGAIYHGLTSLLTQPSPVVSRASPNRGAPPGQQAKSRPVSEDASRFAGPQGSPRRDDGPPRDPQRPLQLQHGARSSPNLQNARSHEQIQSSDNAPYGGFYGNQHGGPQQPGPKLPPGSQQQFRPDPREIANRSKSTTHIDQAGSYEARGPDPRQAMSVSTLPRSISQSQQPQPRYPSHPDLQSVEDRTDSRNKTYENYPQGARPSPQPQRPYNNRRETDNREMKAAQSMGNIRPEPQSKPDTGSRPRSEELDHRQIKDWQQQKPEPNGRRGTPGYGAGVPEVSHQQQQQNLYRKQHSQQPEPQFEQPRKPDIQTDGRGKPSITAKPVSASRPSVSGQESDPRKIQPHFYDPHHQQQQQQRVPQGQYPPQSAGYGYQGNQAYPPSPAQRPPGPNQATPTRPYDRREQSPDLPPPPTNMAAQDDRSYHEDLPPPPPPSQNPEQQIKEEQERMMKRWDSVGPPTRQADSGHRTERPQSQYPPPHSTAQTYQNLPPSSSHQSPSKPSRTEPESHPSDMQYHYTPRPAPAQSIDKNIKDLQKSIEPDVNMRLKQQQHKNNGQPPQQRPLSTDGQAIRKKPPPPIANKPKINLNETKGPSPWEREQKEKEKKYQQEEIRYMRQQEISMIESHPYRSPEEEERLRRLKLDEEFDRRVKEAAEGHEDDGDSDTEMTDRAVGRAKVLQLMQRDVERRQQQLQDEKHLQQAYNGQAELERTERQERRLAQFDQEREEQKLRQIKRQEQKAQETEEYLQKQRDLRDRQRQEFEEQRRLQKQEEEKQMERQREEIRKKKQMEQEQLREIQAAREEEERQLREAARRQEADNSRQKVLDRMQERDIQARKDLERMEKYSHLRYNDPPVKRQPGGPNGAPYTGNTGPERGGPPAPPERKSSYDIYTRSGSMSNLGQPDHEIPGMTGPSRSISTSALKQPENPNSKKSVSFNANLTTEIHEIRQYGSTSSESSYRDYQSQDPRYPQSGHTNTSTVTMSTTSTSSTKEYEPFQRPSYGPGTPNTPLTPGANEVFKDQPPASAPPGIPTVTSPTGTPGVIGAQEVYRDPRDRIAAAKSYNNTPGSEPQRMSFRDKMKMFAKEAGEHTPQDRIKISQAQRRLETDYN